jgi:hypothetical protein
MTISVTIADCGARKLAIASDETGKVLARAEAGTPGEAEAKVRALVVEPLSSDLPQP